MDLHYTKKKTNGISRQVSQSLAITVHTRHGYSSSDVSVTILNLSTRIYICARILTRPRSSILSLVMSVDIPRAAEKNPHHVTFSNYVEIKTEAGEE